MSPDADNNEADKSANDMRADSAEQTGMKSRIITGLRWVAVLPAAILAAFVASIALTLLGWWNAGAMYLNPEAFLVRLPNTILKSLAEVAAFLIVGAIVAPSHRKIVVYVLGGLGLLSSGASCLTSLMRADYWLVFAHAVGAFGLGVAMYGAHELLGEFDG